MQELAKHGVYTKVPLEECWKETGMAPIGTRWVDVNKGDEDNPEYRSRLVAKEIKVNKREDTRSTLEYVTVARGNDGAIWA